MEVTKDVRARLNRIKGAKDFRTYNQTILYLLKKYENSD